MQVCFDFFTVSQPCPQAEKEKFYAGSSLHEVIIELKQLLTKLRFLWNELNLLVLKCLGSTRSANIATSDMPNAFPVFDHAKIGSFPFVSASVVSCSSIL